MKQHSVTWDAVLGDIPRDTGNHVYIVGLDNGIVKVGFSGNPRTRIANLYASVINRFNTRISSVFVSAPMLKSKALATERELKKRMLSFASLFHGEEYFVNTKFHFAANLACQLSHQNGAKKDESLRLVDLHKKVTRKTKTERMKMDIRPLHLATREEITVMAHRAVERGEPAEVANVFAPGTLNHRAFDVDYLQHLIALPSLEESTCAA